MCVHSIKVPIRKKYGKLFNDPRKIELFVLEYLEALNCVQTIVTLVFKHMKSDLFKNKITLTVDLQINC